MSRYSEILRRQYAQDLEQVAIWLVYTRSDHRFKCQTCYDLDHGDAKVCTACFGTGYRVQLQRWLAYYSNTLRRAEDVRTPLTDIGWTNEHHAYVFTRPADVPVVGDHFLVVDWDRPGTRVPEGGQPIHLDQVLRVVFVEKQYAGEKIYHLAHCEFGTEARNQFETALLSTPLRVTRQ